MHEPSPPEALVALLNVALIPAPDHVVVRVTGEADLSCVLVLSAALDRAGSLGTQHVVVDVAEVRFWDLSGLYALVEFTAELAAERRSCRVVGAPAATRRLIELASLGEGLNVGGPVGELPSPAQPPAPRRPVVEHAVTARASASGQLAAVGTGPSAPDRRWRRRG